LASAQFFLGWCFETGRGVPRDLAQARTWYESAAKQGDQHAVDRLAELSSRAQGPSAAEDVDLLPLAVLALGIAALGLAMSGEPADSATGEASQAREERLIGDTGSSAEAAPTCGQEFRIAPASMPCGNLWAPRSEWSEELWCYTDYNMQIGGREGVTYCTDGGGVWERSAMSDPGNGAEVWCDNYGMGPRRGFLQ
jgi:hypothetical protein